MMIPQDQFIYKERLDQKLNDIQARLHVAWGGFMTLTIVVLLGVSEGFSSDFAASIVSLLWIILFVGATITAFSLLKLPKWQTIPLVLRRRAILHALGLSWLTVAVALLAVVIDGIQISHSTTLLVILMGLGYGWLALHLEQQCLLEPDEMFP